LIKKIMIAGAALAGVMFGTAGEAKAATYVCGVRYYPAADTYGSEGHVQVSLNTGANCGGSFVGTFNFCTTGATASGCNNSTNFRYERHGILAMWGNLQRAAAADQQVIYSTQGSCNGGGTGCIIWIDFQAT